MKKVLFIILLLEILSLNSNANPLPVHSLSIQELYVKNDSVWKIDIFDCAYLNYKIGYQVLDSIEIKSSFGSVVFNLQRNKQDQRRTYLYKYDSTNRVVTLTVDSFLTKLHINPKGDYVVLQTYSSVTDFDASNSYDSISFGNIQGAKFPALDSSLSINKIATCDNQYIYRSIGNKPDIGQYSKIGMQNSFSGTLYDCKNNPLANRLFFIYAGINYNTVYNTDNYCTEFKITTDNLGHFDGMYFKSDYKTTLSSISLFDESFKSFGALKDVKIQQFVLDNKNDIHIIDNFVESPIVQNSAFSLYPNPASSQATLKYDLATVNSANVEILDITGKVIERFPLHSTSGTMQLQLGSKYSAGMYVVQVKSGSALLYSQDLIVNK